MELLQARYKIEEKLGEGGMGVVYKALDTRLQRPVAIKILTPTFGEEAVARFMREARSVARLNHPNIMAIYDCDEEEGEHFLVLEYLEGQTLRDIVGYADQQKIVPQDFAFHIALSTLKALEYAHSQGVIHRDLKPENIMVAGEEVKLMDFGLARIQDETAITRRPTLMGTATYMPPEQLTGDPVDVRSDLYAFGVILYEMLAGRRPFVAPQPELVAFMHLHQTPPSPRDFNPQISRPLEYLILKLLEKKPDDRYSSAARVREVLENLESVDVGLAAEIMVPTLPSHRKQEVVGREKEYQQLMNHLDMARAGEGSLVLVSGEAGIGKTHLIEALTVYARLQKVDTLQGRCYEYEIEGAPPYQPFIEALRGYITRALSDAIMQEQVRKHLGSSADELAQLISEVRQLVPYVEPVMPLLDPAAKQTRPFHSVTSFLSETAADTPLLLLLEDLQWADRASLELLRYLVRNTRRTPLMIVGTYRPEEVGSDHPLRSTIRDLGGQGLCADIRLERLSPAEVRAMLRALLQEEVTADFASAIYVRTEGNPLFVEAVLKALIEEGKVYRGEDGRWKRADTDALEIPHSVQEVIRRRLGRLSERAVTVLSCAAVIGQDFNFEVLVAVLEPEMSEGQVLDSLDEALQTDLIHDMGMGDLLGFNHKQVRQMLYNELNRIRRRKWHLRIAETMEEKYLGKVERMALITHYLEGGNREKALIHLVQAGDRARRIYANEEAMGYYQRALALVEELGEPKEEPTISRPRLLESLGDACFYAGRWDKALSHYEKVISHTADKVIRARLEGKLCATLFRQGKLDQAMEHGEKGLELLGEKLPGGRWEVRPSIAVQTLIQAGHTWRPDIFLHRKKPEDDPRNWEALKIYRELTYLYLFMNTEKGVNAHLKLLNLAERYEESLELAHAYSVHSVVSANLGQYERAETYAQKALDIRKRVGDRGDIAQSHNFMGTSYYATGRLDEAIEYLESAYDTIYARREGDILEAAWATSHLGFAYYLKGELREAQDVCQLLIRAAEGEFQNERGAAWGRCGLGLVYQAQGRVAKALVLLQQAVEVGQDSHDNMLIVVSRLHLGQAYLKDGQGREALQEIEKSMKVVVDNDLRNYFMVWVYASLAEVYVRHWEDYQAAGEESIFNLTPEERKDHLRKTKPACQQALKMAQTFVIGQPSVYRVMGTCEHLSGNRPEAEKYFQRSVEAAQQLGARYELGRTYYEAGRWLRQDKDQRATNYLEKARDIFAEIGADFDLGLVEELLAE